MATAQSIIDQAAELAGNTSISATHRLAWLNRFLEAEYRRKYPWQRQTATIAFASGGVSNTADWPSTFLDTYQHEDGSCGRYTDSGSSIVTLFEWTYRTYIAKADRNTSTGPPQRIVADPVTGTWYVYPKTDQGYTGRADHSPLPARVRDPLWGQPARAARSAPHLPPPRVPGRRRDAPLGARPADLPHDAGQRLMADEIRVRCLCCGTPVVLRDAEGRTIVLAEYATLGLRLNTLQHHAVPACRRCSADVRPEPGAGSPSRSTAPAGSRSCRVPTRSRRTAVPRNESVVLTERLAGVDPFTEATPIPDNRFRKRRTQD